MKRDKNFIFKHLCEIPRLNAQEYPSRIAYKFRLKDDIFETKTFSQFYEDIKKLSAGFYEYGVRRNDHVAFFTDNRYEWALTDYSLMSLGAVSVPRGTDTSEVELKFIYDHSDSKFLIVEKVSLLERLIKKFDDEEISEKIKKIFVIESESKTNLKKNEIFSKIKDKIIFYNDIIKKGEKLLEKKPDFYETIYSKIDPDQIVTIIYTSGTTGNPKGVMLTHKNFLHNVRAITPLLEVDIEKGEKTVSILPTWHVYERTYEYCTSAAAVTQIYTSLRYLATDMKNEKPNIMASVPRIWESVYTKILDNVKKKKVYEKILFYFFLKVNLYFILSYQFFHGCYLSFKKRNILKKIFDFLFNGVRLIILAPLYAIGYKIFKPIREKLGGNMRASFSGGGSLPPYVDNFFNAIGVKLVNAYGMTEASPGIISRRINHNTLGATGIPFAETEVKIVKEDGTKVNIGEKGILYARGPQVMKGYYKNPEKTKEVIDSEGWLNTGDLAVYSENGDIVIVGRAKDTIVLLGGENVEPEPIEEKLKESKFIDHAVVMGQDKKNLVAIVAINEDALKEWADRFKISVEDVIHKGEGLIVDSKFYSLIKDEVKKLVNRSTGFKPYEQIAKVIPVINKFQVGKELTHTLKIKRKYIEERYKELIELFTNPDKSKNDKKKKKS